MENKPSLSIFWHRRDLRAFDNRGLLNAFEGPHPVLPVFIFDTNILNEIDHKEDARLIFIHRALEQLQDTYVAAGGSLMVKHGRPLDIWRSLLRQFDIKAVYTNRDYEPYAQERDKSVFELLKEHGIPFTGSKDHVIFEKTEITKDDGAPYVVFTPYMKKWKHMLTESDLASVSSENLLQNVYQCSPFPIPSLNDLGFQDHDHEFPGKEVGIELLENYETQRDFPSIQGTSRLSVHLRFGTVSVRSLARKGQEHSEKWLNELIWRDFYQMLIYHFPHSVDGAFNKKYDKVPWENNEDHFRRWCEGMTGYPIVDAGMRELNATGFMHNRVRMIVASFLTKHLLIDWRWGERYFAEKLLDFELASNVGGWQWAAGCGADAAPYFRVFNPSSQEKKFDPDRRYIRKWVPEVESSFYPPPIVEHKVARQRAIDTYKKALS